MASQVLARKWRPHDFESVIGQEPVVQALTHALRENRLHHAYLFTGTRGVGKTTLSRILAKSLNCLGPDGKGGVTDHPCGVCEACRAIDEGRFIDYIEMDAASNRSVEEMTALLEQAMYAPTNARYKVYMIDEVHQLTSHAFNAMLKTLEEPPEYVKFILATTDPQKVPVTVLSRCLQFNLRNVSPQTVADHMAHILKEEKLEAEPAALKLLGVWARGSMRDGLSLLDQAIAFAGGKPITLESVREMLGIMDSDVLLQLLANLARGNVHDMMAVADQMAQRSLSFSQAIRDLASLLHRIALAQFDAASLAGDDMDREAVLALARTFTPQEVQLYYQIALNARADMDLAPDEYAGFTMALLRMVAFKPAGSGNVELPKRAKLPEPAAAPVKPVEVAAPKIEPEAKKPLEPAPWEEAPVGESLEGKQSLPSAQSQTEQAKPLTKPQTETVAPVEQKTEEVTSPDDDVPYVDQFNDYEAANAELNDYGVPDEFDYHAADSVEEPVEDDTNELGYEYDYADADEQIPEFTPAGRLWYEKLKVTHPASFARDIIERSECVSIEGNVITLHLDPFYENRLKNVEAMLWVQRIVDSLFGHRMQFNIELKTPKNRTIAQERRRLLREQEKAREEEAKKNRWEFITDEAERKAAVEELKNTSVARAVTRRFNARIDLSTVKKRVK